MEVFQARYEQIAIEREGKLLSKYMGDRYNMVWRCKEGHVWPARGGNIKRGGWCPKCAPKGRPVGDNLAKAHALAAEKKGKCHETENLPTTQHHRWECAEGHTWKASLSNVSYGTWCKPCSLGITRAKTIGDNLSEGIRIATKNEGKCLATENFSIKEDVAWECKEGHRWESPLYVLRRGGWCRLCAYKRTGEAKMLDNLTRGHRVAASKGGKCLHTENFGVSDPATFECGLGHQWTTRAGNVLSSGTWCPQCRYKTEAFCNTVVRALFPKYEFRKTRQLEWLRSPTTGNHLELDIFNPELRLAVEYNGSQHDIPVEFYGGEAALERIQSRDGMKADACEKNDVSLVIVREIDVKITHAGRADRQKIVESIWKQVSELGYPDGTHLDSVENLLAVLGM